MPTSFDFRAAVRQALDTAVADPPTAVVDRLAQPDALAAIAEIVHDMLTLIFLNGFAAAEGLEELLGSRDQADVITAAIAGALRGSAGGTLPPDEVLAARVQALAYKDWRFDLVRRGEHRAIRVVAPLPNAYRPERTFTTSRTVTITRSVEEAALQAVLWIEEHEARERLSLRGKRVLSPHDLAPYPEASPKPRALD